MIQLFLQSVLYTARLKMQEEKDYFHEQFLPPPHIPPPAEKT
jgi:hypothetical protein